MKTHSMPRLAPLAAALLAAGLTACASSPVVAPEAQTARQSLDELQSNPKLAPLAPVAIRDAREAVERAEAPSEDPEVAEHLAYLAQQDVAYARAIAERAYVEQQRQELAEQRDEIRLQAREMEAQANREDALRSRAEAEQLRQQLAEMDAERTERGIVMTLGDVLFETGKADLKQGAAANLDKLVTFLQEQPERTVDVEGHTDSTGSAEFNERLSQERADAVKQYLSSHGVDAGRIDAVGRGEDYPIAPNDNAAGRQQNRRVEIVLPNDYSST